LALPCDSCLERVDDVLHRAVTVLAPCSVVFDWLCQLRVAPYSYDWIDNFGKASPQVLDPGLRRLAVGQSVMSIFTLVDFEPNAHLTLRIKDGRARRIFGAVAGTYSLVDGGASCRLVVRLLVARPSGVFRWLAPLLPLGDLVMMRRQLLNLKRLAETSGREQSFQS
jgi:hypothetical protein